MRDGLCGRRPEGSRHLVVSTANVIFKAGEKSIEIREHTLERQCDPEYVEELTSMVDGVEADHVHGLRLRGTGNEPSI